MRLFFRGGKMTGWGFYESRESGGCIPLRSVSCVSASRATFARVNFDHGDPTEVNSVDRRLQDCW